VNDTDKEARLLLAVQTARSILGDAASRAEIAKSKAEWNKEHPEWIGGHIDVRYDEIIDDLPEPLDAILEAVYVLQYALENEGGGDGYRRLYEDGLATLIGD